MTPPNVLVMPERNPTNRELMSAVLQVHDCLHNHVKKTDEQFEKVHDRITAVDVRLGRVEGAQGALNKAAGVGEKTRKPFWMVSQFKAFWGIAIAAAAGASGYKIIVAVAETVHVTLMGMAR